jgi:hypothetical protein
LVTAIAWALALGPAFLLSSVLIHATTIYLHLGRWPRVYRDNPSGTIVLAVEWALLIPSMYWAVFSLPAWAVWALATHGVVRSATLLKQLALVVVAAASLWALIKFDSTGYVEWFLD